MNFNTFGDGGQKISDQQSLMFMHRNLGKSGIYAVYQFRGVLLEDFFSLKISSVRPVFICFFGFSVLVLTLCYSHLHVGCKETIHDVHF